MSLDCQVIGLAAAFQGVQLALDLARDGRCDDEAAEASIRSVLALESDSAAGLYGGVAGVRVGLRALLGELDDEKRDINLTRAVATVLHLERKLSRRTPMLEAIRTGIRQTERAATTLGPLSDAICARLADLYVATVSTMRPRVLIQGNCLHLTQPRNVAKVRALLLSALRGAVLWRQMGGSSWRFLLQRRKVAEAARRLLTGTVGAA